MKTQDLDVVYCIKDDPINEELRYSLRSLQNLPHNKVWIYGAGPAWLDNVEHVRPRQNKGHKWLNARYMLEKIAQNNEITEDFIWLNDDFFIMREMHELYPWHDRDLEKRANDFLGRGVWGGRSRYSIRLQEAARALKACKHPYLNFELHTPIIFNRKKLRETMRKYPDIGCIRSLYSNMWEPLSAQRNDVKIYDRHAYPNFQIDLLSTTDVSFERGKVGNYIRNNFKEKCAYEKEVDNERNTN